MSPDRVENIVAGDSFAALLGIQLVEREPNRVVARMPYKESLGVGRINGGAISALVDIVATAAFWSHPDLPPTARGATVGFTINYLRLAVASDLTATATVRRRGGTLSTGEVTVVNEAGAEVAMAVVTYKLDGGKLA
ncbi:MAG: PaaI family thioesterase [Gammaproteobacteria bacterium]|nr:PaaI family thioesterase [Gammaproteobacteria bacterium]